MDLIKIYVLVFLPKKKIMYWSIGGRACFIFSERELELVLRLKTTKLWLLLQERAQTLEKKKLLDYNLIFVWIQAVEISNIF